MEIRESIKRILVGEDAQVQRSVPRAVTINNTGRHGVLKFDLFHVNDDVKDVAGSLIPSHSVGNYVYKYADKGDDVTYNEKDEVWENDNGQTFPEEFVEES